jgi:hypothetical protein
MRYSKLKNLFSPENETKFPPAIMTALFTKDGELNPKAYALLSTEAQESVKLVSDEIKGAKDTFGARVTNFDLESYMKTLPTLLNTAEGKRVVLRDINLMNKLNIMRNEGVLDIIDKRGAGNISISKAKRMWKKDNAKKIADIKKEYINPGSVPINELDEISALLHPDVTVEDEETGQRFKSIDDQWEML